MLVVVHEKSSGQSIACYYSSPVDPLVTMNLLLNHHYNHHYNQHPNILIVIVVHRLVLIAE